MKRNNKRSYSVTLNVKCNEWRRPTPKHCTVKFQNPKMNKNLKKKKAFKSKDYIWSGFLITSGWPQTDTLISHLPRSLCPSRERVDAINFSRYPSPNGHFPCCTVNRTLIKPGRKQIWVSIYWLFQPILPIMFIQNCFWHTRSQAWLSISLFSKAPGRCPPCK